MSASAAVTLEAIQNDPGVLAYIQMGDDYLGTLGYTEHGLRHANLVGHIAGNVLRRLGYPEREAEVEAIAGFMHDIGNHEEEIGTPATPIGAAIIIGDKADVHHTRVRNPDPETFDIHDRVNYAAKRSFLRVDEDSRLLTLELDIDTGVSQVWSTSRSSCRACRCAERPPKCSTRTSVW